jgi:hypothetical protein
MRQRAALLGRHLKAMPELPPDYIPSILGHSLLTFAAHGVGIRSCCPNSIRVRQSCLGGIAQ